MKFNELSRVQIGENRVLVISKRSDGKISLAQQMTAESDGQEIKFFIKNAIQTDEKGLDDIRKAVNEALDELEEE